MQKPKLPVAELAVAMFEGMVIAALGLAVAVAFAPAGLVLIILAGYRPYKVMNKYMQQCMNWAEEKPLTPEENGAEVGDKPWFADDEED